VFLFTLVIIGSLLFLLHVWRKEAVREHRRMRAREASDAAYHALLDWRKAHPATVLARSPEAQQLVDTRIATMRDDYSLWGLPPDREHEQFLLRLRNDKELPDYPDTPVSHTP